MNRRCFLNSLGLSLALPSLGAFAQGPSGRPLRIVVPLPAGSSNDYVTRVIAPYVGASLGRPVVVDNKAGGNGIIGTMDVLKSAPDGNTLLLGSLSPLAINVALLKNLPYDPRRDLTPIAGTSQTNHVLIVKSTFPARTFPEFLAYAKQRPGGVSIGYSTGVVQIQIATMNKLAGIELLPVPYKGSPATINDVLGGTLGATLTDPGNALAQVKGGQMRALAVSSLKRNPVTPDWPAISETLPGFDFPSWNALVGPPGMPRELVNRISAAVNHALAQKDVVEKYAQTGTIPLVMSPDEVKAFIDAETAKWIRLAREANIQPEAI
jgi:tripartite-type tricarboxylate transporter receptor subunit TctC